MGTDSSIPMTNSSHPFMGDTYIPVSSSRSIEDLSSFDEKPNFKNQSNTLSRRQGSILKSEFYGIWSVVIPSKIGPTPRIGVFHVTNPEGTICYTGCGLSNKSTFCNDVWALDLKNKEWKKLPTWGDAIAPRVGAVASMYRNYIIVFGGFCKGEYFGDIFAINVETYEIKRLTTKGAIPSGRSSPLLHVVGDFLYLWGGFSGEWPNSLSVLDLKTLEWKDYQQNITGRTAMPSVVYKNFIISYGSARTGGLLIIDTENKKVKTVHTTGAEPQGQLMNAGMVVANNFLIYFGGKADTKYTLVYGCDIEKKWWFVFHISPDGETVSLEDGFLSEIGLFMVPRINSFGMSYNQEGREIIAFLGAPEVDPSPLFIVKIGEALSILNIRKDMSDMLKI